MNVKVLQNTKSTLDFDHLVKFKDAIKFDSDTRTLLQQRM